MMSLTFCLFTQVSGSGPLGPLVVGVTAHADLDSVCTILSMFMIGLT